MWGHVLYVPYIVVQCLTPGSRKHYKRQEDYFLVRSVLGPGVKHQDDKEKEREIKSD